MSAGPRPRVTAAQTPCRLREEGRWAEGPTWGWGWHGVALLGTASRGLPMAALTHQGHLQPRHGDEEGELPPHCRQQGSVLREAWDPAADGDVARQGPFPFLRLQQLCETAAIRMPRAVEVQSWGSKWLPRSPVLSPWGLLPARLMEHTALPGTRGLGRQRSQAAPAGNPAPSSRGDTGQTRLSTAHHGGTA